MAWLYDIALGINWAKRIKITIDHTKIDGTLSFFPVMIPITDPKVFEEIGDISYNWRHIAVTEDDEESQCDVEVEIWDHDNQKAWLHVSVPSISSSVDTDIYLYYDAVIDNEDWIFKYTGNYVFSDSSFELVQHMHEVGFIGDLIPDSSSNVNLGTPENTASFVDSQTGKALEFDGDDDGIDLNSTITLTEFSIQVLCKITDYTVDRDICGDKASHLNSRLRIVASAANIIYWRATQAINLTGALPTDTYFLLTITRDVSNNWLVYQNDTDVTSGSPAYTEDLKLGRIGLAPDSIPDVGLLGEIDEFRVYDYALTAAEIKATYNSLFDTLVSFDSEEISVTTIPTESLSLAIQAPVIIPFYVKIPLVSLSLAIKNPSWAWTIPTQEQTKPIFIFKIGGAHIGQDDIEIPISSLSIRKTRVSARIFPSTNYSDWAVNTVYTNGDIVKPTTENGYRYKCIRAGTSFGDFPSWARAQFYAGDRIVTSGGLIYEFQYAENDDLSVFSNYGTPFSNPSLLNFEYGGENYSGYKDTVENVAVEPVWGDDIENESGIVGAIGEYLISKTLVWKKVDNIEPNWPLKIGQTVNDGSVVWMNIGQDEIWDQETAYGIGEVVYPDVDNGYSYIALNAGTSGVEIPIWPTTIGLQVTDGSIIWKCYQRTQFTVNTECSVTIPNGPTWAAAIALRTGGEIRIYSGIEFIRDGNRRRQLTLQTQLPITAVNQQQTAGAHTIIITGDLKGKTNYIAGEVNFPLTKIDSYYTYQGKIKITHPRIYHDIRPGDNIVLDSGSFEAGEIWLNVSAGRRSMEIKEF